MATFKKSKREEQDDQRDALVDKCSAFFAHISALWDGGDSLDVATITITRARQGDGALCIIKGKVNPDGKDYALVERLGGQSVVAFAFGDDALSALCAMEVLLERDEVSLSRDAYASDANRPQAAQKGPHATGRKK